MNIWDGFENFIKKTYGFSLSSGQIDKFKTYLAELMIWNGKINLTGITDPEEILYRHFGDSLDYLLLPPNKFGIPMGLRQDIADIGTGAGFPGIPLKIIYPEIKLYLIESTKKKCMFLEHMRRTLKLENTEILAERTEGVGQNKTYRENFDIVLCRAVSNLNTNLELALPLLKISGVCIFWKTNKSELRESYEVADLLGGVYLNTVEYKLPENNSRVLLIFKKVSPAPDKYPRRVGIPPKKPL